MASSDDEDAPSPLPPQAESLIRFAVENPDQFKLISEMVAERAANTMSHRRSEEYASQLKSQFDELMTHTELIPGQLVKWKTLLKNRVRPAYEEPAIVIELLPTPVFGEEAGPSSTYFREPLNLVAGVLDDDGEMLVYYFDSRRFTRFQAE